MLDVVFLGLFKDKFSFNETCKLLGVAKFSLHRYLSGERKIHCWESFKANK